MTVPLFYISSRGASATGWLAQALSRHPKLVCFHGTRSMPPEIAGSGKELTPDEFMDSLITCSQACQGEKIFGAIHGYYGTSAQKAVESRGGTFSHVIRHPVQRLHSIFSSAYYGDVLDKEEISHQKKHYAKINVYNEIIHHRKDCWHDRVQVDGFALSEVEGMFAGYFINILNNDLICIVEAGKEANFKMEEIVVSPECFERAFYFITDGSLKIEPSYIDEVFSLMPSNKHTENASTDQIIDMWPDSFKYAYHEVILKYGGEQVLRIYHDIGYELPVITGEFVVEGEKVVLKK